MGALWHTRTSMFDTGTRYKASDWAAEQNAGLQQGGGLEEGSR
jgi:uncharacterized protein YfaQ (DUF2300 family)